jgi:hypothetical protein
MVIADDIGSLIYFISFIDYLFHQKLPWQSCKAKEVYQTTYITSNYLENAVQLNKSIRLPMVIAGDIGSLIDFFSFTALSW